MKSSVTLVFFSKAERDHFMGGLSDGWGENIVDLAWDGEFEEANTFDVTLSVDELCELRRHQLIDKKFGGVGLTPDEEAELERLQDQ